jgi:ABC-2 type transport system ATP-binding protein
MQALADDVVIIAAGRLVRQGSVREVVAAMSAGSRVQVLTGQPDALVAALAPFKTSIERGADGELLITGLDERTVGEVAFDAGVALHRLHTEQPDLEDAFLELTHEGATIR